MRCKYFKVAAGERYLLDSVTLLSIADCTSYVNAYVYVYFLGRWEDRVKEYVSERGVRGNGLEWARKECMDRERWRSVRRGHPPWRRFRRERGVRAID